VAATFPGATSQAPGAPRVYACHPVFPTNAPGRLLRAPWIRPFPPSPVSHTWKELLLTSAMQRALQHALEAVDLERLPQGRSVAIGLWKVAIARGEDERRATGYEGIGNRRGGLAVEIDVEDCNVEVGVLRRDARGFEGDRIGPLACGTPPLRSGPRRSRLQ
jgi:hypothetical protein